MREFESHRASAQKGHVALARGPAWACGSLRRKGASSCRRPRRKARPVPSTIGRPSGSHGHNLRMPGSGQKCGNFYLRKRSGCQSGHSIGYGTPASLVTRRPNRRAGGRWLTSHPKGVRWAGYRVPLDGIRFLAFGQAEGPPLSPWGSLAQPANYRWIIRNRLADPRVV